MTDPYLSQTIEFLNSVGIVVRLLEGASGFCSHCEIVSGTINVDPQCRASELLHEAGHLATVPGQYRHLLTGDVAAGQAAICQEMNNVDVQPDSPLYRAVVQMGDAEATAWAYACGKKIGLPEHLIIHDDEYDGQGLIERMRLGTNNHLGINGLSFAGFCRTKPRHTGPLPVYPDLSYWAHPVLSGQCE